jgi:hypothetical protein
MKVKVYKRIAEVILPDLYELDPGVVGDCIKSKLERYAVSRSGGGVKIVRMAIRRR